MNLSLLARRSGATCRDLGSRHLAPLTTALLLGVAGVGCSSGGDSGTGDAGVTNGTDPSGTVTLADDADAPLATDGAGALAGTWFRCGDLANTYVFDGDRFEQFIASYSTPDCSGEPRRGEGLVSPDEPFSGGSFVLGETVTTAEGLSARQLDMTTDTLFGESVFESIRVTQYDIVFTETAGELVFGIFPGDSPENRATELDFESPYVRR